VAASPGQTSPIIDGVTRVYLIRHGQSEWNEQGRYQGQTDSALSALGRRQAFFLAEALADVPLCAVYSSRLVRAYDTAATIAARHRLPVVTLELLREIRLGEWEGLTEAEITARHGPVVAAWRRNAGDIVPGGGGETLTELRVRGLRALREMLRLHRGETIAAVGHGGLNKMILLTVLGSPTSRYWHLRQDNGAINILEFGPNRTSIVVLNETAHLADVDSAGPETAGTPAATDTSQYPPPRG
jgi:phosphoserine phosphatase